LIELDYTEGEGELLLLSRQSWRACSWLPLLELSPPDWPEPSPSLEDYDADFSFSGLAALDSSKLCG
tara:strand:- start:1385 stop:1585 length:201 start_codon:yes stop_codon:yes gene_type:complete